MTDLKSQINCELANVVSHSYGIRLILN